MFRKDEYVFYESGGICKIADVQISPLDGMPADRAYYVMQSVNERNGVMYIPVDSEGVFLRPLLDRDGAEALIDRIPHVEAIDEPNAKLLRAKYIDAMRTHEPEEWVRVIKTVRRRMESDGRAQRLSETERSFLENARRYLYTELSLALGRSEKEMAQFIDERIGKMA